MVNPFRYLAYDLATGTYLGRLPYQNVSFGMPRLNAPGPFSGSLALADPAVQRAAWQTCTYTGRTAIVVDLLGTIVWGGILWTNDYQDSDRSKRLKVSGSSFGSYLQQRVQARDYSATWSTGADPMAIAEQVISDALALGSVMGGVTIALHPAAGEGGPQTTPSYPATAVQSVDSIVSILSQMGYGFGFDYSFDVAYSSGAPAVTCNIWYPRQGRTAGQTQLVILQRNLLDFTYSVDSTRQATSIFETGSGTGGVQPVQATASLPAYPRLERAFSRTQVNDDGTLGNIAAGDLALYAWPVITPTVTLRLGLPDANGQVPAGTLALGSFLLGDDLTWRIDPLAGGGQNTCPRFPNGMNAAWRINGWTATVADQAGQIPTLKLDLATPPTQGVPSPPPL